ncbi:MAG: hypothetical protein QXD81_05035 [Candidatus Bathyarchaeia archaeon]
MYAQIPLLHRMILYSFLKAGLSLYGTLEEQEAEMEDLIKEIPIPYRGLMNGELYLYALNFMKKYNSILKGDGGAVILNEANLYHIVQFLENRVGRVDAVLILDCASIPEFVTIASKFHALNRNVTILDKVFINPIGITRFLTYQLKSFDRESYLRQYAQLLKERLKSRHCFIIPMIDLSIHEYGFTLSTFLKYIKIQKLFDEVNNLARQNSLLLTADHGYDIVADEHGLYMTHGYEKECPIKFSRIAPFLIID